MFIFLFLCSLLVPLSMTFLGYTWKDNPPKDRQGISGYRTTMSRINDETWKYAHKCWGSINFVLGIILAILSIFVLILMCDAIILFLGLHTIYNVYCANCFFSSFEESHLKDEGRLFC